MVNIDCLPKLDAVTVSIYELFSSYLSLKVIFKCKSYWNCFFNCRSKETIYRTHHDLRELKCSVCKTA